MPVNAFSFIDMYAHALQGVRHFTSKGFEHACALGVAEAEFLDWRLAEDMQPLRFQLMLICNFATEWPARFAGLTAPDAVPVDLTLDGFKTALSEALAFLGTLKPEAFEGRDEVLLTVPLGGGAMNPTLTAGRWLTVFATTNLYFHVSTAYGILRSKGAPIGKMDLFAGGL